jgi:peroxiredoxin
MIELGELEKRHEDFARKNLRVIAVSVETPESARETQKDFPHLMVASDHERKLSNAVEVIHAHSGPGGEDTSAPTTILVDRDGTVRWLFRPNHNAVRLSSDELLAAANEHLPAVR